MFAVLFIFCKIMSSTYNFVKGILWNYQTHNVYSYNVSHCCFITLKIKCLKTKNVILRKHLWCTKQYYYMVILLNFPLSSFLGKCPFFIILSSKCILASTSPCLKFEGQLRVGERVETHTLSPSYCSRINWKLQRVQVWCCVSDSKPCS